MAPTIKKAEAAFQRVLKAPTRVLEVDASVSWPAGAPARQQALYGAVVVMTVAAWQGLVEDIAAAARTITEKRVAKANVSLGTLADLQLGKFNTPNKANTRDLFNRAGLALPSVWSITSSGSSLNYEQSWEVIDAWLQVRHAIAHGFSYTESEKLENSIGSCPHVAARVLTGNAPGKGHGRVLRRVDVEGCMELIENVAGEISMAATTHQAAG